MPPPPPSRAMSECEPWRAAEGDDSAGPTSNRSRSRSQNQSPQVAPEPRLTKAGVGLPLEQTAEAGLRQQVAELQKQGPGARARSQNLVRYPAVSL